MLRLIVAFTVVAMAGGLNHGAKAQNRAAGSEPILRIEAGMHSAPIQRLTVDANCSLMATGSYDKTVKVWRIGRAAGLVEASTRSNASRNPPGLELLRTLRVPIGPGHDGKVFAMAMAPNGSWIAAGGWDAIYPTEYAHYVSILDTSTGRQLARLGPLGNVILHMAVSQDGEMLAATLGRGQGLAVWRTSDWKLMGRDKDYGGRNSLGATFGPDGQLYTVAADGKVRRYRIPPRPVEALQPRRIINSPGGRRPYGVAAHPDGETIAVGYDDTRNVDILDAWTLERIQSADIGPVDDSLHAVSYTADGSRLFAAGRYQITGGRPVRIWTVRRNGRVVDGRNVLTKADDTILTLLPCANGIAIGTTDPAAGLLDDDGGVVQWQGPTKADMRGNRNQNLLIGADAKKIRFGLGYGAIEPVMFSLEDETLTDAKNIEAGLTDARMSGLPVTNWDDSYEPKFDGRRIELERREQARALAVAPDRRNFVLAASYSIRGYDANGNQIWKVKSPSETWGVNIPRNGGVVVAVFGDGTARWYRLSDGKELLALFVHAPDRRWIAWTPRGYYLASPGAEKLIGWHVNRGWKRAPDFYPAAQFRDRFNRPDIVKRVLDTLDEDEAISNANANARQRRAQEDVREAAPPLIWIEQPGDNATFNKRQVSIVYRALPGAGDKIVSIEHRVNGLAARNVAAVPRSFSRDGSAVRMTLELPPEDVELTLIARNELDKASAPATVRLRWDGATPGAPRLPRLRGVFIGTNAYRDPALPPLAYPVKDAQDMANLFKAQKGRSYRDVEVRVVADGTRGDIIEALEWLEADEDETRVNLLFLAGHGVTDERGNYYYMGVDGQADRLRASGVPRGQILRTVRNLLGHRVIMLDTCHSGGTVDGNLPMSAPRRPSMNVLANEIANAETGVVLYASTSARQLSYENDAWGNGAFTKAMLEGLSGKVRTQTKRGSYVDAEELSLYVRKRVVALTDGRQVPIRVKPDAAPELKLVWLD